MLELYEPKLEDLWFRQKLMSDETTMSYNHSWGGIIPFPENKWSIWYNCWIIHHENQRFYRYLRESDSKEFVGEIAYHFDCESKIWIADVIIFSKYRRRGYGSEGLKLLCESARKNGIGVIYDNIAIDNPGISIFLKTGFSEEYRTDEIIMLKKNLE